MSELISKLDKLILDGHQLRYKLDYINEDDFFIVSPNQINLKNRFDIIIKFNFVFDKIHNLNDSFSLELYSNHIAVFSSGTFLEPYSHKNSLESYLMELDKLISDIKTNGFSFDKSVIPLNDNLDILDGSHRVAICMVLGEKFNTVKLPLDSPNYGYDFFKKRGLSHGLLDRSLLNFIERNENIRIGIIWPKTFKSQKRNESLNNLFSNLDVIVSKKFILTYDSMRILILHAYYEAEFLGKSKNGFKGLDRKASEVFLNNKETVIFFFRSKSNLEDKKIKENFRSSNHMTHNAIHMSDTKNDTLELSRLLLNEYSSKNFVKNKFVFNNHIANHLEFFKTSLKNKKIDSDRIIITGSLVLELYGLRPSKDVDFIYDGDRIDSIHENSHNDLFNETSSYISNFFRDTSNYFYFWGFKIITLENLVNFKMNRGEKKDHYDLTLIKKFYKNSSDNNRSSFNKGYFFFKLSIYRFKDNLIIGTLWLLKLTKLYGFAKIVYNIFKKYRRKLNSCFKL